MWPVKAPMVAGREAMDWAKMMGMTPLMFTFIGMCGQPPAIIFRPQPASVLHRQAALSVGDEHDEDHQGQHAHYDQGHHPGGSRPFW